MPRYRVTQPRVLAGYDKCSYQYAPGDELDDETAPEGHVARLMASGALEALAQPESAGQGEAARPSRPRLARAGRDTEEL